MSQEPPARRPATVLESVEDLRAQIRRGQAIPGLVAAQPPPPPSADDTAPLRPTHRASMALLVVHDDGEDDGETVRLRDGRCVIGRAEGNVLIPHDGAISGRHAEITRRPIDGGFRWFLKDLNSSNGTFVRISRSILAHGQEILLGGSRFRLENASVVASPAPESGGAVAATRKLHVNRSIDEFNRPSASLVEVTEAGGDRRFPLAGPEQWIGRDPRQCPIAIDDPMINPRHARIYRDDSGRWHIENARSLNGVWMRITEIGIERSCHFLCGEQRFLIRVL